MRWPSKTPSEHQEQMAVIEWADSMRAMMPEASLIFAIPNGGSRFKLVINDGKGARICFSPEGKKLRAEGVKRGIPDLFLPVSRQEWHGLFIEMKSKDGKLSLDQQLCHGALTAQGYAVCVCRGADAAITAIGGYLTNPTWSPKRRE